MTSPQSPERPSAAGVFVVRDPDVCAALEALLQPHYTGPVTAPTVTADDILTTAVACARGLLDDEAPFNDSTKIEDVLNYVHTRALGSGRRQATTEGRAHADDLQDRLTRAETSVAHAERELDKTREQLEDALAKITELESRPSGRRPTVSALRLNDQKAWATLADRMDREALSQSKVSAAALKVAAKGVRDEIAIIYGNAERKAS